VSDSALGRRLERRLLILAPVGKDAALIEAALAKDGVDCIACPTLDRLAREYERGAAALLLAEEALTELDVRPADLIARQPPWSDIPVLVLTRQGADSAAAARALRTLGNVTLLERPVRLATLNSAVLSALRARERQYQMRAHLQQREEADRRKDAFLAMLAHELRNPLAPIRNSVSVLRLSQLGGRTARVLEMMERQVGHMARLVDDLMEVSRITLGKIELRKQPVHLAAVINAALETSRPLIDSAKHQLTVSLPPDAIVLDADMVRLAQVFSNLLNNAAKYAGPGASIVLSARREGPNVVIAVNDDGPGIPADALPHVFDMFSQAHARGGHSESGLGIGLTLVRDLVELHGGSVVAASDGAGRGSQFTVRLPLGAGDVAAPEHAEPAPGLPLPRILVVDDNHDAADSLGLLLQMLGAVVQVVHDGRSALGAIDSFCPGVVMLDLGMPDMDGYEVARHIRERPDSSGITLIALTGWGQDGDREFTKAAGFAHHIVKPAEIAALQALLSSLAK